MTSTSVKVRDFGRQPAPAKRLRLLLVDDHPLLRAGVISLLKSEGDLDALKRSACDESGCDRASPSPGAS